jgi:alpha-tubulin suppressor-like RCC1 family protein
VQALFLGRLAVAALILLSGAEAHAKGPTRTRLVITSPSPAGQSVSMTAEVDALGAGGAPGGRVTFTDGATPLGWAPLNPLGAGQATLATGLIHNCAVTRAGGAQCWGANRRGQLGDGTTIDRLTPVPVAGLSSGVVALAAGAMHSCALTEAGGVKCWGDNGYLQLGMAGGDRTTPVTVPGLASGVVAIAAGWWHTCALTRAGIIMCWGYNNAGQLGADPHEIYFSLPAPANDPGTVYAGLSATASQSCGLTKAGAVKCWGGYYGYRPTGLPGLESGFTAVAAGHYHVCALTVAGGVKCRGSGPIGDGLSSDEERTVTVSGLANEAVAIAAGGGFDCALLRSGGVKCWGSNYKGVLGDGTTITRLTPTLVAKLGGSAVAISSGFNYTCALLAPSRALRCWGENETGQLGDGTKSDRLLPVTALGFVGALRARARLHAPLGVGRHMLRAQYPGDADHPASASPFVPQEVR